MEFSSQHAPPPRRPRRDNPNKENICPIHASDMAALSADLGWRQSPLPDGFPRFPLQDITHILCPHNIFPDGEDPLIRQVHKKLKKGKSAEDLSVDEADGGSKWHGLTSCMQLRLARRQVLIENRVVPEGDEEQCNGSTSSELTPKKKVIVGLHVARDTEQVDQSSDVQCGEDQGVQALGTEKQGMEAVWDVEGCSHKGEAKIGRVDGPRILKQKMEGSKSIFVQVSAKQLTCRRPHKPMDSTNRSSSNIMKFR